MALKHAILAALQDGEATGYELSKRFDVSVANFWPATPQQIYRELDRLETDGMLEATLVEQSSRPNKRLFSVTSEGHDELAEFIRASARADRDPRRPAGQGGRARRRKRRMPSRPQSTSGSSAAKRSWPSTQTSGPGCSAV